MARPEPPERGLDPLTTTVAAGMPLHRVFQARYGPTGFNPSSASGRFRPLFAGPPDAPAVVPTMYLAADRETALAEGLLRGVDDRGARRRLFRHEVTGVAYALVTVRRELTLVRLNGPGLGRLGLLRAELIDSDKSAYPWTARWAQALHDLPGAPDGLLWTSRQNDSAAAMIVFGDGVAAADVVALGPAVALDAEPGLDLVRRACEDAGIDFEG
jgi:hypothetical protein